MPRNPRHTKYLHAQLTRRRYLQTSWQVPPRIATAYLHLAPWQGPRRAPEVPVPPGVVVALSFHVPSPEARFFGQHLPVHAAHDGNVWCSARPHSPFSHAGLTTTGHDMTASLASGPRSLAIGPMGCRRGRFLFDGLLIESGRGLSQLGSPLTLQDHQDDGSQSSPSIHQKPIDTKAFPVALLYSPQPGFRGAVEAVHCCGSRLHTTAFARY